tara:strand:+ start:82 stop:789 length:708 start_codon:yes stop_codon:yes gene_type:complete
MKYKRILLKLSGEALMGDKDFGIDVKVLNYYAQEIKSILSLGIELAIVIGGGNIFRGIQVEEKGLNRVQGDYMGMLATMINGMALQSSLEKNKIDTRLLSAIKMEQIAESFIRRRAMRHLDKGRVVIFGSGTGNPFFSTDTAAALRAIEVEADLILKGTNVDGVFSDDPKINKNAEFYTKISYSEVIQKKLKVMDMTAFTMCEENKIPIIVCNINNKGNLSKVLNGDQIGTLINF